MRIAARFYISTVLLAGVLAAVFAALRWECQDAARLAVYMVLSAALSIFKLRLPGSEGTFSANSLLVLVAVTRMSYSETIGLAMISGVVQCLWRPEKRTSGVQVAFNCANFGMSAALAYGISHGLSVHSPHPPVIVLLAPAVFVFFICNIGVTTGILALIEARPFRAIWSEWMSYAFPFYLIVSAMAGLMAECSRAADWRTALAVLPLVWPVYTYSRLQAISAKGRSAR